VFQKGNIYRHISPNVTLDIFVVSVNNIDEKRIKLQIRYINRKGELIGDFQPDKVQVLKKDLHNWRKVE
jgi:hypothetical protein